MVYPRVCGGTTPNSSATFSQAGLSPRVRGNRVNGGLLRLMFRSIPACAGEPSAISVTSAYRPVYPRVCGGTGKKSPSSDAL